MSGRIGPRLYRRAMNDYLEASGFTPAGGSWSGLLFSNPTIGLKPRLTLRFEFEFDDVGVDDEEATLGLSVEWAPWPAGRSWQQIVETAVECAKFGEPVEASIYHYEHHRFDQVDLQVLEQRGQHARVRATLSGDIDQLGVPTLTVESWLTFAGIYVQLDPRPGSITEATAALGGWTSADALVGTDSGHNYLFSPSGS